MRAQRRHQLAHGHGLEPRAIREHLGLNKPIYARTAAYDAAIARHLEKEFQEAQIGALPKTLWISAPLVQPLRYGENPHQSAALYVPAGHASAGIAGAKQIQGKELSYNNLVDLDSAWALAKEFKGPGVAIIKHNNPCGAAEQDDLVNAYLKALACDPVSAFGGVLADDVFIEFRHDLARGKVLQFGHYAVSTVMSSLV